MRLNDALVLNDIVKALIDNKDLKISSIFKFRLLGIAKNLEVPVANYHTIRDEKIVTYGTVNEETNVPEIKPENKEAVEKFQKDMTEFLNSEIDIEIQKLKVNEVFDAGVPSDYLVHLYHIIEE